MSTPQVQQAKYLLEELEQTLKACDLWSEQTPADEALASPAPFCCDTLHFEQWLQFIFIPRLSGMLVNQAPLPDAMKLLPMAQQSWAHDASTKPAQQVIARLDLLWEQA